MIITNCKYCNSSNLKFIETPESVHYGKMICGHCNKFSHWVSNPESKRNNSLRTNKKTIKEICQFHNIEKEICFFCLRNRNELGWFETLTIDHIQELDKGGTDTLQNMQVLCSACHKLKNWVRLYINWHLTKKEEKDGDTKATSN